VGSTLDVDSGNNQVRQTRPLHLFDADINKDVSHIIYLDVGI